MELSACSHIRDSLAAEQVKTLFGAPWPSITREAESIERSSRCTPSSGDTSPQGRRREHFSQTGRVQDKLDTMGLESLPLLSRNAELSIQTWKPCPGGVSSAPLEDAPLPAQKKNRQTWGWRRGFLWQRRALGSQGEGQRGVELRERWEESEQEDRGGARTRAGQTHRIWEPKTPQTQRKTVGRQKLKTGTDSEPKAIVAHPSWPHFLPSWTQNGSWKKFPLWLPYQAPKPALAWTWECVCMHTYIHFHTSKH